MATGEGPTLHPESLLLSSRVDRVRGRRRSTWWRIALLAGIAVLGAACVLALIHVLSPPLPPALCGLGCREHLPHPGFVPEALIRAFDSCLAT